MYEYQDVGVKWLQSKQRALLADEMGLGKTRQTIRAMSGRVCVVCPAVVKGVWAKELAAVRPELTVQVIKKRTDTYNGSDVVIVNYELIPEHAFADFDLIVADEAHMLGCNKSARTIKFRELAKHRRVWLLTGTPITDNPKRLWDMLVSGGLHKQSFGGWEEFCFHMGGKHGRFGMEWGEPRDSAHEKLSRVMLRRTRAEVLPDLPGKTHQIIAVPLPVSIKKMHEAAEREIPLDMLPGDIGRFAELRKLTAMAKMDVALSLVAQYEDNETKLIVASAHTDPIQTIGKRDGWAYIDGTVSESRRNSIVNDFQNNILKGVAINIKAGGIGITLTAGSTMLFVDQEWTPALNEQAEDRICRIGQKNACHYIHLVGETRLEERVWSILNNKKSLCETVL